MARRKSSKGLERRAIRAEEALQREHGRRQQEARRSLLAAMVTDLASGFVNAPSESVDRAILQALQELCHAVGGDRAILCAWDASTSCLRWGQAWSRRGVPDHSGRGPSTCLAGEPAWRSAAGEGRIVDIANVLDLAAGDPLRELLSGWGVGSILALPLMEEERCTGFLVVETVARAVRWSHDEFSALVVAAELFSNSAMRRQREGALERALDEARAALRAKDAFLANLTHELRTPLNGVIGSAELLAAQSLPDTQRHQVSTIQGSASHLLRLLDDLLDFVHLESGGFQPSVTAADVRLLLENSLASHAPAAAGPGVELRTVVADDVPRFLLLDPAHVQRVLHILLRNALQHTASGSVRLCAAVAGDRLRIAVEDTGSGIPIGLYPLLFRPFMQADTSNTRRHGGLGLGLAIAHRICAQLGGSITAEPHAGGGARFAVDLPMRVASQLPEPVAGPAPAPCIRGLRVLVIEDNQINRMVAVAMLQQLGCQVDTADDGIDGAQKALRGTYAIIFMDIQMPRMDGIAATRAIRGGESRSGGRRTPIVALTCLSQEPDKARAKAAGMDGYLTKPIAMHAMSRALSEWARSPTSFPRGEVTEPPTAAGRSSAAPTGTSATSPDLGTLHQLEQSSPGAGRDIARTMLKDLGRAAVDFPSALKHGEFDRLAKEAHKLKGAAGSVGGSEVALASATLELAAKKADAAASASALDGLIRALHPFAEALAAYAESEDGA